MKALRKDFFREIRRNKGRFISVFFIVLLGAAFFSGLRSSERDMLLSAEQYYDDTNLMDIRILGSLGLTDDDLKDIAKIDGVENAYGGYTADVLCSDEDKKSLKLIAYSDKVNRPTVVKGRLPANNTECLVDELFLKNSDYKIGDTITFRSGDNTDLNNTLKRTAFTIVGSGNLPYYMDLNRGTGTVGSGKLDGFVLIMPDTFSLDYFSEIYVRLLDAQQLNSFDNEYKELADTVTEQIKQIAPEACQRRYDTLYEEADKKITDAKKELADNTAKLKEAKNEISRGEQQITKAETELDAKQSELNQEYTKLEDQEHQLDLARQKYSAQSDELVEKKDTFAQQQQDLADAEAQLESKREQYTQGKAAYEAMLPGLEEARTALSRINQQIATLKDAGLTELPEYTALLRQQTELSALLDQGNDLQTSLKQFEQKEQEIRSAKETVQTYAQQIAEGEAKLASARQEIEAGQSRLTDARNQLDKAEQELTKARTELEEKKETLEKSKIEYLKNQQEAEAKIENGRKKIADAENELSGLSIPEWYVLDREMIPSYTGCQSDSQRIGNMGKLLPFIFFFVAALVSLTAMTRMVEEQRQQVGILKALGSDNRTVLIRYLLYALLPTVLGAVSGVLIGEKVLPLAILYTYSMLYNGLTSYILPYNLTQGLTAILASAICTGAATLFACYKITRANPARIMRQEAPQSGKRVWMEKITFLWKRLSFTQKSTIRNMFRYKKRFFMTLFGVSSCMGLVLVGLGLHDSIMVVCDKQFSQLTHYQAAVYTDPEEDHLADILAQNLSQKYSIGDSAVVYEKSVELFHDDTMQDTMMEVPKSPDQIHKYFTFRERTTGQPIAFPSDGAIISEKTASLLGVSAGDTVQIKNGDLPTVSVTITAVYENYIRHYIFLSADTYEKLYGSFPEYNQLLIRYPDTSERYEQELGNYLMNQNGIQRVSFVSETIRQADDTLSSLNVIVYIVLTSAGLLAFVVLYNLNNINITERKRELATLKVLGFYDTEVASYIYKENILLTVIGIFFGMAAGVVLHQYVIKSIEVDMIMFGRTIAPVSFLIGAVLTLGFSVIINLAMYRSIKKIDMIESLKSIE